MSNARQQNRYDHRLRDLVRITGDIPELLKKKRREAQMEPLERNRALSCGICEEGLEAA